MVTFDDIQAYCSAEITKVLLEEVPQPVRELGRSHVIALASAHLLKQLLLKHWQKVIAVYGIPQAGTDRRRPKWGQRGRRRLRKTRLAARRRNERWAQQATHVPGTPNAGKRGTRP